MLRDKRVPRNMQIAIICPVLKPGKDRGEPSSYRPIALLSCLFKMFEIVIRDHVEKKMLGKLADNQ